MPSQHRVQQGDTLYTIAKQHGFLNWRTIYDAPENDALRSLRPNPQVLESGDVVVIPDNQDPALGVSLDKRTVVAKRKRDLQPLRVILRQPAGGPLVNQEYRLTFAGGDLRGKTDSNGLLREEIPVGTLKAQLQIGKTTHTLMIGFLDPLEETPDQGIEGMQGRLKNLGFYDGPIDGKSNPELVEAIRSFQAQEGLPETGEDDEETQQRLLEIHGS
jgi:hypothetical protein